VLPDSTLQTDESMKSDMRAGSRIPSGNQAAKMKTGADGKKAVRFGA